MEFFKLTHITHLKEIKISLEKQKVIEEKTNALFTLKKFCNTLQWTTRNEEKMEV